MGRVKNRKNTRLAKRSFRCREDQEQKGEGLAERGDNVKRR